MGPFDNLLADLIKREGGFSHLSADKGGATKFGITQATLAYWRNKPVTVDDVRALTEDEAITIYAALYIVKPHLDALPSPLGEQMVDFAVNSGPPLAIMALQEVLKVTVDGKLGPRTMAALSARDLRGVNNNLVKWRVMMLARIVRRDPSQLTFLGGWLARALDFYY